MPGRLREWSADDLPCSWALMHGVTMYAFDDTQYAVRLLRADRTADSPYRHVWRPAERLE